MILYDWPIVSTFPWLCRSDSDCQKLIGIFGADPDGPSPPVYKCGKSIDYGVMAGGEYDIDGVRANGDALFDLVNFNNIGSAMLTVFQVLSLENWTDGMMYVYMDASNLILAVVFFVSLVVFGSFFIMNLVLAQIVVSFDEERHKRDVDDNDDNSRKKGSLFRTINDARKIARKS